MPSRRISRRALVVAGAALVIVSAAACGEDPPQAAPSTPVNTYTDDPEAALSLACTELLSARSATLSGQTDASLDVVVAVASGQPLDGSQIEAARTGTAALIDDRRTTLDALAGPVAAVPAAAEWYAAWQQTQPMLQDRLAALDSGDEDRIRTVFRDTLAATDGPGYPEGGRYGLAHRDCTAVFGTDVVPQTGTDLHTAAATVCAIARNRQVVNGYQPAKDLLSSEIQTPVLLDRELPEITDEHRAAARTVRLEQQALATELGALPADGSSSAAWDRLTGALDDAASLATSRETALTGADPTVISTAFGRSQNDSRPAGTAALEDLGLDRRDCRTLFT